MTVAVYLPLLASLAIGGLAPVCARRVPPTLGARLLAALATIAAAASVWTLLLLAATLADDGSPAAGRDTPPVADPVAMIAFVLLVAVGVRVAATLRRLRRDFVGLDAATSGARTDLVVLADARPEAFAVPARRRTRHRTERVGTVVVTDSMLRALTADQRRALFAHERAHLAGGHHRMQLITSLAAAINPMLTPAARAVAFLCERSADEHAAAQVGDRRVVADAVATAALAVTPTTTSLAFGALRVIDRVQALRRPAPSRRVPTAVVLAGIAGAIVGADLHATGDFLAFISTLH